MEDRNKKECKLKEAELTGKENEQPKLVRTAERRKKAKVSLFISGKRFKSCKNCFLKLE